MLPLPVSRRIICEGVCRIPERSEFPDWMWSTVIILKVWSFCMSYQKGSLHLNSIWQMKRFWSNLIHRVDTCHKMTTEGANDEGLPDQPFSNVEMNISISNWSNSACSTFVYIQNSVPTDNWLSDPTDHPVNVHSHNMSEISHINGDIWGINRTCRQPTIK